MRDLTQHLTTRADDSHAAPVKELPCGHPSLSRGFSNMSSPGKVLRVASNRTTCSTACVGPRQFLLVLALRPYSPGGVLNALASTLRGSIPATSSTHRLRRGLPGYLILFAPHAFASQRQSPSRWPPSPLVFLPISTDFTPTPGILPSSPGLEPSSFECSSEVEPRDFTSDLPGRLHALYAQ